MNQELKIFAGNSNIELSKKIANYLGMSLGEIEIKNFPDGEIFVQINENIRGKDVFIIQSGCAPVNQNLMELLIILDTCKRSSVSRITAVMPYYCYARQDVKDASRVPITAKLVADLILKAGANRLLTIDLHSPQIQGFFDIPVDHLYGAPIFVKYFNQIKNKENYIVVSPDVGRVKRSRSFARRLDLPLAIIDKRRPCQSVVKVMEIIGDVKDKNIIIFDDIIDTGGTILEAVKALKEKGAKKIFVGATHAIFSLDAVQNIENSAIEKVIISDTIPLSENKKSEKIEILSISELFGEAIKRIHTETSVSDLFK
ncbi:MAG: ribose-phosphate pyrophosphokinase [bacterium]